jgi:hypothetical protein
MSLSINKIALACALPLASIFSGCATTDRADQADRNPFRDSYIIDLPGDNDFMIFPSFVLP